MGQYYKGYVNHNGKEKVFSNRVDDDFQGYKLMEHSWYENRMVANVVNDLFYHKGKVCWVGDYYDEDDCYQRNCIDREEVSRIGVHTWSKATKETKCTLKNVMFLNNCLIVNHTKKVFINCNEYFEKNKQQEEWNGKKYFICIHPLPLLTCSANHSGGSYYGINKEDCGTWFNDEIEIVLEDETKKLEENGFKKVEYEFKEDC